MVVDLDFERGKVLVKDSEHILGLIHDVLLTPDQVRAVARNLEAEGKHTVAAAGLFKAADDAERREPA
ncbi:hypothetical protein H7J07_05745 [Mycobacterium koreense]|uniref:Uncharacterized protein n=1 Tax=Mycolicibacillus koreensis TaxID=1069220 RepID=A0A7I7SBM1_9MYCO|nr:hypothetical protein [Mycolicibacillus koreensis]MCV7247728.1 hypothetical protein [Mycolicibacillus koreensis]OSC34744.1 hypothetical protein B8W67_05705 [Mycolicibacillus koreensis]BBY54113.1 hypothetical protein MKOR_13640 [Mycolicibacillus koreensis]